MTEWENAEELRMKKIRTIMEVLMRLAIACSNSRMNKIMMAQQVGRDRMWLRGG